MTNPFLPQQPAPAPAAPQQPNPYAAPPAPQGYGQQPQYTQQPAQNPYAQPQQQQYPAQQQTAPVPPGGNGLVAQPGSFSTPPPPSATGSGNMPKIGDLQGRLLIVLPESLQRGLASKFMGQNGQAQTVDRLTATVVVLDGGPLQWGGTAPGSARQNADVPYVIKGLWIQQTKLIEQLDEPLRMRLAGQPGLALGRLWKTGTEQNAPYVLAAPSPQDAQQYDAYDSQVNPFAL
jgi:hypothetical protein